MTESNDSDGSVCFHQGFEHTVGIVQPKVNELHAQPASVLTSDIVPETSKLYPFYGVFWMMVNTLATVGIVFTNKAIFSDLSWKSCQLSFASFHFVVTWFTLYVLSRPQVAFFAPRRAPIGHLVPLAVAMCLNVILPNLSLAHSSVIFYQIARILLTPSVALMNLFLYSAKLPLGAVLSLIPACLGVAMVSYYDASSSAETSAQTTSPVGITFAFTGVFASSLYTVWIASYHKRLRMSSMQLLFNQAPIASFLLLYAIPFVDTFPVWAEVPIRRYLMIALSGMFASLINISQFFIVVQTGPVSSTVVGHLKTCTIVVLGWIMSDRVISDRSIIGIGIALSGIIAYSSVTLEHKPQVSQGNQGASRVKKNRCESRGGGSSG